MTAREEAEQILAMTENDIRRALSILDGQLNTLHARAQVLMSLCGVVITVTGFSGRTIAGTSPAGKASIVAGLATVLLSAIWLYGRVMRVRWLTGEMEGEPAEALTRIIERRNRKTRDYMRGGVVLCCGFALYCIAVAIMLFAA